MTEGYEGFGYPKTIDPHHFTVQIPTGRSDDVVIVEDFGLRGGTNGVPERVDRCRLARTLWTSIASTVKQAFNERLKEKNLPTGRWVVGENRIDRLLGKELCVLSWGIEAAREELVANALRNWLALSPEERWWLFSKAVAAAGLAEHVDVGWRKAIRIALTEVGDEPAPRPRPAKRRSARTADDGGTPLLDLLRRAEDGG
ncbi:MAG: anti-phage-associated DUF3780 domain-containing protein [Myxococcota bacterium]